MRASATPAATASFATVSLRKDVAFGTLMVRRPVMIVLRSAMFAGMVTVVVVVVRVVVVRVVVVTVVVGNAVKHFQMQSRVVAVEVVLVSVVEVVVVVVVVVFVDVVVVSRQDMAPTPLGIVQCPHDSGQRP